MTEAGGPVPEAALAAVAAVAAVAAGTAAPGTTCASGSAARSTACAAATSDTGGQDVDRAASGRQADGDAASAPVGRDDEHVGEVERRAGVA